MATRPHAPHQPHRKPRPRGHPPPKPARIPTIIGGRQPYPPRQFRPNSKGRDEQPEYLQYRFRHRFTRPQETKRLFTRSPGF
ncbi:hypothetical protein MY55_14150 [Chromobacterium subtsugae]|nr:hypothetical protein MY55_14150 [Chromobacterium subtsugae]